MDVVLLNSIDGRGFWVYTSVGNSSDNTRFFLAEDIDEACEYFTQLLIVTGYRPQLVGERSAAQFRRWLDGQPNKAELVELINLRELV